VQKKKCGRAPASAAISPASAQPSPQIHPRSNLTDGGLFSQVPSNFRFVIEQTLREFFKAIQGGKDAEQSWKKSIYKVISRLDDPVPEYFKSPNFLEQLE